MRVDGTNLSMIRGDSESITIACFDQSGEPLLFNTGDTIYFTVKLNTSVEAKILQKIITIFDEGAAIVELLPQDTAALQYRTYKYDVQWVTQAGRVTTIVPPSAFTIGPEVTFESPIVGDLV